MGSLMSKHRWKSESSISSELFYENVQNETDVTLQYKAYTVTHLTITRSTIIPQSVGHFRNLTHLDLSNNGMELVPWFIMYLKELEVLNLSHNQLKQLPPTIFFFSKLTSLDLSYNLFENLSTNLLMYKSLKKLDVEGNLGLVSPPLNVCLQGIGAIFEDLKKGQKRTNVWANWTPYYTGEFGCMKTLVEWCIDSIINSEIDYLAVGTIPPTVKKYIASVEDDQAYLMKCSTCKGYFTKRRFFDNHVCSVPQ